VNIILIKIQKDMKKASEIRDIVCECMEVSDGDILGRSMRSDVKDARHMFWLILEEYGWPIRGIGRLTGYFHPSVRSGINSIRGLIDVDALIKARYREIKKAMES
jgi:chromosomal replication initiation ATPase DnaA